MNWLRIVSQCSYDFHSTFSNEDCVVPVNAHTNPMEGIGNTKGWGEGIPVAKNVTGNYEAKLMFSGGKGV